MLFHSSLESVHIALGMPGCSPASTLVDPEQFLAGWLIVCQEALELLKMLVTLAVIMEHVKVTTKRHLWGSKYQPKSVLKVCPPFWYQMNSLSEYLFRFFSFFKKNSAFSVTYSFHLP
jgi:hypothetical protein